MDKRKSVFVYNDDLERIPYPSDHPFNTSRAPKTRALVHSMGWLQGPDIEEVQPEPASRMVLKKVHSGRYLHALKNAAGGKYDPEALNMGIGSGDCPVFPGLYEHAVLATGQTVTAAQWIIDGQAKAAFNPSGGFHHAFSEKAAGFCYINDVAIGCTVLAQAGMRVLYLDVDVHNGDGVAGTFYDRPEVMTISLHENPRILFPGTGFEDEIGTGDGKGYCVNVPLPVGTYDAPYLSTFEELVLPLASVYAPDVVVFELGADALAGDPLAHLRLTNNTYVEIIKHILAWGKPVLMTGGGGYHIENTVRAWALAWSVLSGAADEHDVTLGMGGVMLDNLDWSGGLKDRDLVIPDRQRESVTVACRQVVENVKANVFGLHGL
jgi:acetoin utilization protein AcuC